MPSSICAGQRLSADQTGAEPARALVIVVLVIIIIIIIIIIVIIIIIIISSSIIIIIMLNFERPSIANSCIVDLVRICASWYL